MPRRSRVLEVWRYAECGVAKELVTGGTARYPVNACA